MAGSIYDINNGLDELMVWVRNSQIPRCTKPSDTRWNARMFGLHKVGKIFKYENLGLRVHRRNI